MKRDEAARLPNRLTPDWQLSHRSTEAVVKGLKDAAEGLHDAGIQFFDAKVRPGHLINAFVLEFMAMPKRERIERGRKILAMLENHLEHGRPSEDRAMAKVMVE